MKWCARLILLPLFCIPMIITLLIELSREDCDMENWVTYWGLK